MHTEKREPHTKEVDCGNRKIFRQEIRMADVTIYLPPVSADQISADLRWLTEVLDQQGAHLSGGLLGGEFGYGAEWDNATFEMHPFYWGDCECGHEEAEWDWCEANDHSPTCYQSVIRDRGWLDYDDPTPFEKRNQINDRITIAVCREMGLDENYGRAVHCTCDYKSRYQAWLEAHDHDPACGVARPNFLHKPSGTRVDWYKYIGRGMQVDVRGDWRAILADCVDSLAA